MLLSASPVRLVQGDVMFGGEPGLCGVPALTVSDGMVNYLGAQATSTNGPFTSCAGERPFVCQTAECHPFRRRLATSEKESQFHCTPRRIGWASFCRLSGPARQRLLSGSLAVEGAPAGCPVFHMPPETMTVLLHSRPPSPSGSRRWSVTVMCPVLVTAVSGSAAFRYPSASLT